MDGNDKPKRPLSAAIALSACSGAALFCAFSALRLLPGWSGPLAGTAAAAALSLVPLWIAVFAACVFLRVLKRRSGFWAFAGFRAASAAAAFAAVCAVSAALLSPDHFARILAFVSARPLPGSLPEGFRTGADFWCDWLCALFSGECPPFSAAPSYVSSRWNTFALDPQRSFAQWKSLAVSSSLLLAGLPVALSAAAAAFAATLRGSSRAFRFAAAAPLTAAFSAAGAALAFLPSAPAGNPRVFEQIAARDTTYGGSPQISSTNIAGYAVAWNRDVPESPDGGDFKGPVLTIDGRPAIPGSRFFRTRALNAAIPAAEAVCRAGSRLESCRGMKMLATGIDSYPCLDLWRALGAEPQFEPRLSIASRAGENFDLVCVFPEPDWKLGADRPDASFWKDAAAALSPSGVCAWRIDARLMPPGRMRTLVEDFASVFPRFRAWCTGPHDWIFAGFAGNGPDVFVLPRISSMAAEPAAAALLVKTCGPALEPGILSCFAGSAQDVTPALLRHERAGSLAAQFLAPEIAFSAQTRGEVECGDLLPAETPSMSWCRGEDGEQADAAVAAKSLEFMDARRNAVRALAAIAKGDEAAAFDLLAAAAAVNPDDAVLRHRRDLMAIQCLQTLRKNKPGARMEAYKTMENLAAVFPKDAAWQYNLGRHFLEFGGRADLAAQLFSRAAALADISLNPEYQEAYARTVFNAGQYALARDAYLKLAGAFPRNPRYLMSLARILGAESNPGRDLEAAERIARKAVDFSGGDPAIAALYADFLIEECHRPAEGLEIKRKLRQSRPERQ